MQVAASLLHDVPLYTLQGEIDHTSAEALRTALEEGLERSGGSHLLLDLEAVSYIDSGGLTAILWAVRRLRDRGWLGVIGPNADIVRLLEIVGLTIDTGLRVFTDQREAGLAVENRPQ